MESVSYKLEKDMEGAKLDYAPFYLEVKRLLHESHNLLNKGKYEEAKPLVEELTANAKLLLNVTNSRINQ